MSSLTKFLNSIRFEHQITELEHDQVTAIVEHQMTEFSYLSSNHGAAGIDMSNFIDMSN